MVDTVSSVADIKASAMEKAGRHAPSPAGERDRIFSLLAFAVALRGWQESFGGDARGHNVAAVLVDEDGVPVSWGKNAVTATGNSSEHAETRAMNCYLERSRRNSLEGCTIYTTLEPEIMCAGTMILLNLSRTVYGQTDPDFGGVMKRLAIDSSSLPGGMPPYPRLVVAEGSTLYHRYWLDLFYEEYCREISYPKITKFLRSPEARHVFQDAKETLLAYEVEFPENKEVLENVLEFYSKIPARYVDECGK